MKIDGTFQEGAQTPTPTKDVPFTNDLGYGSYPRTVTGCNGTFGQANWLTPTQSMEMVNLDPMRDYARTVDIPVYWQATGFMNDPQGSGSDNDTDRTEL